MKNFVKLLIITALAAVIVFAFTGCRDGGGDFVPADEYFQLVWQGSRASAPLGAQNGWVYFNTSDNKLWVSINGVWQELAITAIPGEQGPQGEPGVSGTPGATPHIGANGNWWIGITDTGVKAAGTPGAPGTPGATPHIGANGNWWIGATDTNIKATGPQGSAGSQGPVGPQGPAGDNGTQLVWKDDTTAPANPQEGWLYYNAVLGQAFIYLNGGWNMFAQDGAAVNNALTPVFRVNTETGEIFVDTGNGETLLGVIKGPKGDKGDDGISILWQGTFTSHPASPYLNWAYYNNTNNIAYIWDGSAWQTLVEGPSPSVFHWYVFDTATWQTAVNGVRTGGNNKLHLINVYGNFNVEGSTEDTFGSFTGITVVLQGSGTISLSGNGNLLRVGANQMVIVKDLKLMGYNDNYYQLVYISGKFTMQGSASVSGNACIVGGGGVYVDSNGTFTMQDNASVSDNYGSIGGVIVGSSGTFTMQGNATVSGNTANSGGGVYVGSSGTFIMQDNASVSGNIASSSYGNGGGVYVGSSGTFIMQDNASVSGNIVSSSYGEGGGVYVDSSGTFTMEGNASVFGNTASYRGGGVSNRGTFTMDGNASVSGNTASESGGGVFGGGTFIMKGNASVSGNTANSGGGGVWLINSTFTMEGNASVSGNTANGEGGGVYVDTGGNSNNSTFIMKDNTSVSGNSTGIGSIRNGGGVYVCGTFIMEDNASVSGNTATNNGGGVFVFGTANSGGGVNVIGTFTMQDNASVSGNTANNSYGGVYISGTFTMQDNASVSGNTANNSYGGVYIIGTFIMEGGTVYGIDEDGEDEEGNPLANNASGNGAVLYRYDTSTTAKYGDGTDILPHPEDNQVLYTDYTIVGR